MSIIVKNFFVYYKIYKIYILYNINYDNIGR